MKLCFVLVLGFLACAQAGFFDDLKSAVKAGLGKLKDQALQQIVPVVLQIATTALGKREVANLEAAEAFVRSELEKQAQNWIDEVENFISLHEGYLKSSLDTAGEIPEDVKEFLEEHYEAIKSGNVAQFLEKNKNEFLTDVAEMLPKALEAKVTELVPMVKEMLNA